MIFLLPEAFRSALKPTQTSTQVISLGGKRLGREADYSPLASAEIRNMWASTPDLQTYSCVIIELA
jgi:hypothetical protein